MLQFMPSVGWLVVTVGKLELPNKPGFSPAQSGGSACDPGEVLPGKRKGKLTECRRVKCTRESNDGRPSRRSRRGTLMESHDREAYARAACTHSLTPPTRAQPTKTTWQQKPAASPNSHPERHALFTTTTTTYLQVGHDWRVPRLKEVHQAEQIAVRRQGALAGVVYAPPLGPVLHHVRKFLHAGVRHGVRLGVRQGGTAERRKRERGAERGEGGGCWSDRSYWKKHSNSG